MLYPCLQYCSILSMETFWDIHIPIYKKRNMFYGATINVVVKHYILAVLRCWKPLTFKICHLILIGGFPQLHLRVSPLTKVTKRIYYNFGSRIKKTIILSRYYLLSRHCVYIPKRFYLVVMNAEALKNIKK